MVLCLFSLGCKLAPTSLKVFDFEICLIRNPDHPWNNSTGAHLSFTLVKHIKDSLRFSRDLQLSFIQRAFHFFWWCLKLNAFLMRQPGNWLPVRSALLSGLLGSKQIRLGVPKVPWPLHTGDVGFSERVTSLMEIHFDREKIHCPSGHGIRAGIRVHQIPKTEKSAAIN